MYITLYCVWGISLQRRIVNKTARRCLCGIASLMVFWFVIRTLKYNVFYEPVLRRYSWYGYYVPLLSIPSLSVIAALKMRESENQKRRQWTGIFLVITVGVILLVMTNDLHQLVFRFPAEKPWTDDEYFYGPGFVLCVAWIAIGFLTMLGILIAKCRNPGKKKIWLPFVPLGLFFIWCIANIFRIPHLKIIAGDMAAACCLLIAALFESCIQCGLIQSNRGYDELLEATTLPVQITDETFCTKHASATMRPPLPQSELRQITQDTVQLDDDTLLKRHKLRRGWAFWKEDVSKLNQLRQELELTCDELRDVGDVLAAENAQHARLLKLTEENRLYDMMEAQTARQIAMLQERLTELKKTDDPARAERLLGQIIVIGTYIKRRNNLIFVGVQRGSISVQELRLCLNESAENLCLYGAECSALIKGDGQLSIEQATAAYSLFEAVVEAELESLRSLLVSIEVGDALHMNLCISGEAPLRHLKDPFPALEWEEDEDGLQYVMLRVEKSGGK